ncbi:hypothetical protein DB35_09180 [Streptomyces abyssalis]|uniref:CBM2 domain-containing protein n=1 Tax=Streptomyces abyssalis TaxID=933944 RepID=A0A1E7JRV7_9ACTN|nr:hypothetical protein AN215_03635 [Streptomyces abyssalis]OEU94230.1 hypothetical protein DB35_09180 [Streptomyces abyssalis]
MTWGLRVARAAPAGAGAVVVLLLALTVVLQQVGAWPFARHDIPSRSVPDARLPLPPSAVGSGGSPSDGEGAGRAPGGSGEPEPGAPGDGRTAPGVPGDGAPGDGEGTADCGCKAVWHVDGQWEDFNATVRVTNTGEVPVRGWQITWTWPDGQRLVKGWNAEFRESGAAVTVRNGRGNAEIPTKGQTAFGFQATRSGSPAPRLTCHVL